jgi:hypothetical protein
MQVAHDHLIYVAPATKYDDLWTLDAIGFPWNFVYYGRLQQLIYWFTDSVHLVQFTRSSSPSSVVQCHRTSLLSTQLALVAVISPWMRRSVWQIIGLQQVLLIPQSALLAVCALMALYLVNLLRYWLLMEQLFVPQLILLILHGKNWFRMWSSNLSIYNCKRLYNLNFSYCVTSLRCFIPEFVEIVVLVMLLKRVLYGVICWQVANSVMGLTNI